MKKKGIVFILLIFITLGTANSISASLKEEMEIYDKTLRLHILANSDSEQDQALKLKVKDEVVALLEKPLSDCTSKEEAEALIQTMRDEILTSADNVIKKNGFDYSETLEIVTEHYPVKKYEGITMPAGTYSSVKIQLGKSDGQNWWCVLFPQVCTGTATPGETLAEVGFTANQIRLLTEQEETEYVVKFKIIEVLSSMRKK